MKQILFLKIITFFVCMLLIKTNSIIAESINDSLPADITLWVIDLKYNEETLKILEFEDDSTAGFSALNNTHGPGIVWKRLWQYLEQFNLPIWYVGHYTTQADKVAWNYFRQISGRFAPNLPALMRNRAFQLAVQKNKAPLGKVIRSRIQDYEGIIVLKYYHPTKAMLELFRKKYPQFLIIGLASHAAVQSKPMMDSLFDTPELRAFRPQCYLYPKIYSLTLAQSISKNIPSDLYVIKPVNSGKGNGIIMSTQKNLDNALKKILVDNACPLPPNNNFCYKPHEVQTYEYWQHDRNTHFLVEEFATSKPLYVNNKPYDPTMRIVYLLKHEQGEVTLNYITSYWKKPLKALNEKGTLREKHINKHAPDFNQASGGLEVDPEDLNKVRTTLETLLPTIYTNLLERFHTA